MSREPSTRDKIIVCGCCGYTAAVHSYVEAYNLGWRLSPVSQPIEETLEEGCCPQQWTCPLCPMTCLHGHTHEKAHKLWEQEGRPKDFSLEKCAVDGVIDNPAELRRARRFHKNMRRLAKRRR